MGRMKELFMKQMDEQITDMSDIEYQEWLALQDEDYLLYNSPAAQAEVESEHDAWWDSLTNGQKEELFKGQEEVFKLSIEEMNYHDNLERMIGFGLR